MGHSKSKPINNESNGPNSNADTVNVTLIENLKDHQSTLTTILIIIAVVVIMHFVWKVYKSHVKSVRRVAVQKSRDDLTSL